MLLLFKGAHEGIKRGGEAGRKMIETTKEYAKKIRENSPIETADFGDIFDRLGDITKDDIRDMKNVYENLPSDLSGEQVSKIVPLKIEKENLIKENSTLTPTEYKQRIERNNERIKTIDTEIDNISSETPTEIPKKPEVPTEPPITPTEKPAEPPIIPIIPEKRVLDVEETHEVIMPTGEKKTIKQLREEGWEDEKISFNFNIPLKLEMKPKEELAKPEPLKDIESTTKALENIDAEKLYSIYKKHIGGETIEEIESGAILLKEITEHEKAVNTKGTPIILNEDINYKEHPELVKGFRAKVFKPKDRGMVLIEWQKRGFKDSSIIAVPEGAISPIPKLKIVRESPFSTAQDISELYHKAKAESTNPELVKEVEESIRQKPTEVKPEVPTEPKKAEPIIEKPTEPTVETPQFKEHIVTGKEAGKYQVEKVGDEVKILNIDSGKYVKQTRQNQWAIDQYIEANKENFQTGKKAEVHEAIIPDEIGDFIADNSNNPKEIAETWLWQKQSGLKEETLIDIVYKYANDINPKSFKDYTGLSTRDYPHLLKRFKKDGIPLDTLAERIAEASGREIWAIEEQAKGIGADWISQIVDILTSSEFKGYKPTKETQSMMNLDVRFRKLTGLPLTESIAKKIIKEPKEMLIRWAEKIEGIAEEIPDIGLPFIVTPRLLKFGLETVAKSLRAGATLQRAIKLAIIKIKEMMKPDEKFDDDEFRKIIKEKVTDAEMAERLAKKVKSEIELEEMKKEAKPITGGEAKKLRELEKLTEERMTTSTIGQVISETIKFIKENPDDSLVKDSSQRIFRRIGTMLNMGELIPEQIKSALGKYGLSEGEFAMEFMKAASEAGRSLAMLSRAAKEILKLAPDTPETRKARERLKTLEKEMSWNDLAWTKFMNGFRGLLNIWRGLLVTQLKTAIRNAASQSGRMFQEVFTDVITGGVEYAKGDKPFLKAMTPAMEDLAAMFRRLKPSERKRLNELLEKYAEQTSDLYNLPIQEGITPSRIVSILNTFNRFQEVQFRKMAFDSRITTLMKEAEVKEPTDAMLTESVNHALNMTFADPKAPVSKALMRTFHDNPWMLLIYPFPRFFGNVVRHVYHYSPAGFMDLISPDFRLKLAGKKRVKITDKKTGETKIELQDTNPHEAYKNLVKAGIGTSMIAVGMAIRNSDNAGEKWYEINISGKTIDTRFMAPIITPYLFMGDLIMNYEKYNERNVQSIMEGLFGMRPAAGTTRMLIELITGQQKIEGIGKTMYKFIGEFIGGFATPFNQVKDLIATVEPEESIVREKREHPLIAPAVSRIPFLSRTLPPKISITRGEPMKSDYPIPFFLGLNIKDKTYFESEIDRLGIDYWQLMPKIKTEGTELTDEDAVRTVNLIAKQMGKVVIQKTEEHPTMNIKEWGESLKINTNYQNKNDKEKEKFIKTWLSRFKKFAKIKVYEENPELKTRAGTQPEE